MNPHHHRRRFAAALVLLLLPLSLLSRPLLRGEAFVPADLLANLSPWRPASSESVTPWNVLRFDGITQFYPWRNLAREQIRSGRIPLWNPFQFGAEGGTPLIANSQSAPLYPPNLLFYVLPSTAIAFGWVAALHLWLAALGTYLFLRGLPLSRLAALIGAAAFALSGPVVTWMALPTFLAVSCWLPWLLLLIRIAHRRAGTSSGRAAALGVGGVAGTLLLAGHLQVAFYCLLAGGLYALHLGARALPQRAVRLGAWIGTAVGALVLAVALAAAQLLPSVELSRVSHRVVTPTWDVYRAYSSNALPVRNLVTLLAPNFFGHPNAGTYWNSGNYAEFALYIGVLPLFLAVYALFQPWRLRVATEDDADPRQERLFLAGLALLSLLMSLGTPINVPFFFGVTGFGQTGSPARALILFGFAASALAAMGVDALRNAPRFDARRALGSMVLPLLIAAVGANFAAAFARASFGRPLGELFALAPPEWEKTGVLVLVGGVLLCVTPRLRSDGWRTLAIGIAGAITVGDLLAWGIGYNPSSPIDAVYPTTPGIRWLQTNARDALIAPINRGWSLSAEPPRQSVLPPNGLTVYGLHDLGGYDSLFYGSAKRRVAEAGGGEDPSPPENGNIVFIKRIETARALGARFILLPPGVVVPDSETTLRAAYSGPDMTILENAAGRDWTPPERPYLPTTFRLGLFLGLCGVGTMAAASTAGLNSRRRRASSTATGSR